LESPASQAANYIGGTIKAYWAVLSQVRSQGLRVTAVNFLRLLRTKFLEWCSKKGDNGGILTNGNVLLIVIVQLALWFNMNTVSKITGRMLNLPQGKRRPDVTSWRCRIIGWLVENGAVLTLCNLRALLPHPKPIPTDVPADCSLQTATAQGIFCIARNVVISIASNLIAEQGSVFLLHTTSTKLYPQVKPFQDMYSHVTPYNSKGLLDWLQGNGVLQIAGGGIALGMIESFLPTSAEAELSDTPFTIPSFLKHFGVFRIIVIHQAIHCPSHTHIHTLPTLDTNAEHSLHFPSGGHCVLFRAQNDACQSLALQKYSQTPS
jgi:hypothetical protein